MTILAKKDPLNKKREKILIVDDNPLIRELLEFSVSSFGFDYASAEDGLQAIEKLQHEPFSIVITDMIMPNMDGMQLLKHITNNFPRIGVIVITGYTGSFSYTDVIMAGASDFITKPFTADELEAKLNRLVREQTFIRELEHLSMCDALTNLYNRRYFDVKLKEEIHRAHRQNYPLYLTLLDLDRFKEYNDTYGHQAGDLLLQAVSKILLQCTRENVDWAFRYGGDEFAIINPYINHQQAVVVAERIIHSYGSNDFGTTGLSIGLARFIRHDELEWTDNITDLVRRADQALYQAKADGKNRVHFNEEEIKG
ncbi:MAG: diguanylate cyclase response regulator [Deltaproteobacteria bacterium RIFOXYD12_FULL_50_9]|nr:MAG: diguanylate cyclase response regulator [Deltaproteobacteria bacterium RIFOXYD12_FULL_50_9]